MLRLPHHTVASLRRPREASLSVHRSLRSSAQLRHWSDGGPATARIPAEEGGAEQRRPQPEFGARPMPPRSAFGSSSYSPRHTDGLPAPRPARLTLNSLPKSADHPMSSGRRENRPFNPRGSFQLPPVPGPARGPSRYGSDRRNDSAGGFPRPQRPSNFNTPPSERPSYGGSRQQDGRYPQSSRFPQRDSSFGSRPRDPWRSPTPFRPPQNDRRAPAYGNAREPSSTTFDRPRYGANRLPGPPHTRPARSSPRDRPTPSKTEALPLEPADEDLAIEETTLSELLGDFGEIIEATPEAPVEKVWAKAAKRNEKKHGKWDKAAEANSGPSSSKKKEEVRLSDAERRLEAQKRREEKEADMTQEQLDRLEKKRKKTAKRAKKAAETAAALNSSDSEKDLHLPETISVQQLAKLLTIRTPDLERLMRASGMEYTSHDHLLTGEESSLLAMEYGFNPIIGKPSAFDILPPPPLTPEELLHAPLRAPIVTIMGHVDHGKTTLLDTLRKTSVAAREAGGITQHIGAFSVQMPSNPSATITFLDTPGHAAFTAMRARGAQTTDIVILVVAADDSVMPQTIEAIQHAHAAGVPIVVAMNKCDKHDVDKEKTKVDLIRHGVELEDIGGEVPLVEVSGLTGAGLNVLEETVLAVAEMQELRATPTGLVEGFVVESNMDKGQGAIATLIVRRGTLHVGDVIVAGEAWAKVKTMTNHAGEAVDEAGPSTPVVVTGWKDVPSAGEHVLQSPDGEDKAKLAVANRRARAQASRSLEDVSMINQKRREAREVYKSEDGGLSKNQLRVKMRKEGSGRAFPLDDSSKDPAAEHAPEVAAIPELPLIVKGDVTGTMEAVVESLMGLPSNEARLRVIHHGVGPITESDVDMAIGSNGAIFGFNVDVVDRRVLGYAAMHNVRIISNGVIYRLLDEAKAMLVAILPKKYAKHVKGEAKILQTFSITGKNKTTHLVAGCRVTNGTIKRNDLVRIFREGETIFEGSLDELKHVKKDIQEASKGSDCGMAFSSGYADFRPDDIIQMYELREEARTL